MVDTTQTVDLIGGKAQYQHRHKKLIMAPAVLADQNSEDRKK